MSVLWKVVLYDPQQAQLQSANTGRTASASCSTSATTTAAEGAAEANAPGDLGIQPDAG